MFRSARQSARWRAVVGGLLALGIGLGALAWGAGETPTSGAQNSAPGLALLKAPMQGVLDRQGAPRSGFENVVNGYVVNVDWADLQPGGGDSLATNNPVDQALAAVRARTPGAPLSIKLRVFAGSHSPSWALNLGGAPIDYFEPQNDNPAKVPRFWTKHYGDAYSNLQRLLADRYDSAPEIRDVTINRCMTVFAEPFIRGISDASNRAALLAAGYTPDADKACHREQIAAHTVWATTRSSLAFNPWQFINPATGSGNTDVSFTLDMMHECRAALGYRCILENNSIRDAAETAALGPSYQTMYSEMKALGPPLLFQTATPQRIGNWSETLGWAVAAGANAVELNSAYPTYDLAALTTIDLALEANRTGPVLPTLSAPVATATPQDSSVALSWVSDNTVPVTFVPSYRSAGNPDWTALGEITANSTTVPSLVNGKAYEFEVVAAFVAADGTRVVSSPSPVVTATPVAPAPGLAAPSRLTGKAGRGYVDLSWQDSNRVSVDFVLSYRRTGGSTQYSTWQWPGATSSKTFRVSGLTKGKTYEFRVRARYTMPSGERVVSAFSPTATATVLR